MPSPRSLLVVDDSAAERELMALTLNAAFPEADIRRADRPMLAKEMCGEEGFDCVLVDYNMPDMDGMTLASELKSELAYLPIILMTSVGSEMLAAEALRCGISDYIPKSRITTESLRRVVDRSIHDCLQARLIDEQRSELENFAYALAHDFKQPIRQITTFTQLIAEELRHGAPEAGGIDQHLTFLSEAAARLGRLVDVMSQYTLLNQPPELREVDLGGALASVRASLSTYLEERGGELILPARPPRIFGNETLLIQVLQNLVVNGLKYNQSRVPRVKITVRRSGDNCVIHVQDNGLGIDPEYLTEVFKPLVRLHTASEYSGSGLGLTLARKAVVAQKGAIWCQSKLGQGSVFHVRLPAAEAVAASKTPKAQKQAAAVG